MDFEKAYNLTKDFQIRCTETSLNMMFIAALHRSKGLRLMDVASYIKALSESLKQFNQHYLYKQDEKLETSLERVIHSLNMVFTGFVLLNDDMKKMILTEDQTGEFPPVYPIFKECKDLFVHLHKLNQPQR